MGPLSFCCEAVGRTEESFSFVAAFGPNSPAQGEVGLTTSARAPRIEIADDRRRKIVQGGHSDALLKTATRIGPRTRRLRRARTVNIDHRGTTMSDFRATPEELEQYRSEGYFVREAQFSDAELEPLRDAVDGVHDPHRCC